MLQCVAECSCRALEDAVGVLRCAAVCRSVLQYVACVAECCCMALEDTVGVLLCAAMWCSVL